MTLTKGLEELEGWRCYFAGRTDLCEAQQRGERVPVEGTAEAKAWRRDTATGTRQKILGAGAGVVGPAPAGWGQGACRH